MSPMHRSILALPAFVGLVLFACGESTSTEDTESSGGSAGTNAGSDSGGRNGDGGTSSGGEGASAGESSSGGNSATAGDGSEGGGSNAGSGGDDLGGSGGEGVAGNSSEGGSPRVGSGTSGGASSAGEAGAVSTAGSSGSGEGGGYQPPANQVEGCEQLCEREAEANCPNDDPLEECINNCNFAIRFEPCSGQWDDLFECLDSAEEVECDDEGESSFVGCESESVSAVACVLEDGVDEDLRPGCTTLCEAQEEADCDASNPANDCTAACTIVGSAFPLCSDDYEAYLDCGGDADIVCSDSGEPEPEDCGAPFILWLACLVEEYDVEL